MSEEEAISQASPDSAPASAEGAGGMVGAGPAGPGSGSAPGVTEGVGPGAGPGIEPSGGEAIVRSGLVRWMWFAIGWAAVGLGSLGVIVPGLPTTVFFIVAASCFARSSPRFERWVLGLPRVGALVRDHRAGLGMPRRAKAWAIAMVVVFAGASVLLSLDRPVVGAAIAALGAVGIAYIAARVPTRERVLAERHLAADPPVPADPSG